MNSHILVAPFHDYGAAHRAFCELRRGGVPPQDISIIAGDRSNRFGANRDFGILDDDALHYGAEVRRGLTLVAVRAAPTDRARLAAIVEHHAPTGVTESAVGKGDAAIRTH